MTVVYLDAWAARPYSRAHDQDRDHFHRLPPPPYVSGMGGHLRLRYQPLPPDRVPRHFLLQQRDLIRRLTRAAGDRHVYQTLF
jgi:hypothetical protein